MNTNYEEHMLPPNDELFSVKKINEAAFNAVLKRLIGRDVGQSNGPHWRDIVEDFIDRININEGEIAFVNGPPGDLKYGYYTVFKKDGSRLGNMPFVVLPADFWQIKGNFLDNTIGDMLVRVMELSREHFLDENRIKDLSFLKEAINEIGVTEIVEHGVPKFG